MMANIRRIIIIIVFTLAAGNVYCEGFSEENTENLIMPPANAVNEIWSYKHLYYPYGISYYKDNMLYFNRRKILVAIDGADIYFQGLSEDYPENWVKAELSDKKIIFSKTNLMGTNLNLLPIIFRYFKIEDNAGWYEISMRIKDDFKEDIYHNQIHLEYNESDGEWVIPGYKYWETRYMEFYDDSYGYTFYEEKVNVSIPVLTHTWNSDYQYWYDIIHPMIDEKLYIRDPRFIPCPDSMSLKTEGADTIEGDEENPSDIIYDLMGRQCTDSPLTPGIYIRNGKKIMVR